jgi:hypothetical protein
MRLLKSTQRRWRYSCDDMAYTVLPFRVGGLIGVWGNTWEQAKCVTECIDYLCQLAVEMKKLGLDPAAPAGTVV